MRQAGRGGWAVVRGGAPLPGLAVESATTGSASGEADSIWGGCTANTVCGSNWSSLIRNSARRSENTVLHLCSQAPALGQIRHTKSYSHNIPFIYSGENQF